MSASSAKALQISNNTSFIEKNDLKRLIVLLAQSQSDKKVEESSLNLLQQKVDWPAFCRLADEQRVFSIVYERIEKNFQSHIDEQSRALLRQHRQQIAQRNLALSAELLRLIDLLKKNQIPVLAYKGAAFSSLVYEDATFRQFTDLDLLIEKPDFPKVRQLFIANNCQPISQTEKLQRAILRYDYEMQFLAGSNKFLVELHWQLAEHFFSFRIDWNELLQRKIETNVLGRPVATFSPEDTLIVHCAHASKHLWKRLGWIVDVAELIARRTIDWDLTIALGKNCGALRMVYLGVWLATQILSAEVPRSVWQRIENDKRVAEIGEKLKTQFSTENARTHDWKLMARTHLKMRERFSDKLLYSYRLLVTTKLIDSLFMPLGRPR